MKPLPLLAALLILGCAQPPAQNNLAGPGQPPQPDPVMRPDVTQDALMDRIEREVRLPGEARPLATYRRLYAWHEDKDGTRTVVGYYENLLGSPPGRHWVTESDFPLIADGGCGVIRLIWNVAAQRIEQINCNGYA